MVKKVLAGMMIAVMLLPAMAGTAAAYNAVDKLGRGVCNIITGWAEIPVQIMKETRDEGHVAAMTVGVFKGIFCAIGRTLGGVVEAVTFPVPAPSGYRSLIEPEFVLEPISK